MKIFKIAAAATVVTALLPLAAHAAAYQTTRKFHPGHYSVILPDP